MTVFGWDASHYDGVITPAIARRAAAEGIVFATHKVGEGGSYDDPGDRTALAAFRDAGIQVIGGYYVVRSGHPIENQVAHCIALADRDEPWWRDFPGWFWQVDLERWPADNVPASLGIALGAGLEAATGRRVVMYASNGMYGSQLRAWAPRPLWNANYGSNLDGPFRDLYPGDGWRGWSPYSGMTPALLQYSSRATIAGLTTCDANAFRGTLAELLALINPGGVAVGDFDKDDLHTLLTSPAFPYASAPGVTPVVQPTVSLGTTWLATRTAADAANGKLDKLIVSQAGQDKVLALLQATLTHLATDGTSIDTEAVLDAIAAEGAKESDALAQALAEIRRLEATIAAAELAQAETFAHPPTAG